MNRIDDLTSRLIDGTMSDAEAAELQALLAADPAALSRHLAAIRLELALRGLRTEFAIAEPTIAKIEADRVVQITEAVMAQIARRPMPGRSARHLRVGGAAVVGALVALLTVWLGLRNPQPRDGGDPAPFAPEFARLTAVSGAVEVAGTRVIPGQAQQLRAGGQTIRTVGEGSIAVVEFPDGTRLKVHPESVVQWASPQDESDRKLVLVEGHVTVAATRHIVVVGGATQVETSRGTFSVCSAGSGSAWVESTDGEVRVHHGATAEPLVLGPGQASFIPEDAALVRIDSQWQIDSDPLAQIDFAALDVGFGPDGEVWAVSAKQWTRWMPGTPEPGRTQFTPQVGNDGLAAWLTPDRRAVAVCRIDDREERITIRDLPSGAERRHVPVRVSEPRFLCVAPDASWIATAGGPKPHNRRVCVWHVETGAERFAVDFDNSVTCLAVSIDGRQLAIGVSDLRNNAGNLIAVLDPLNGERMFDLATHRKAVYTLAFSADGKQLAAGFNGAIQLWDVHDRTLRSTLQGFERGVTRLAFSPDGDLLAAGMQDGQVWVWATQTGQYIHVISTGTRGVRSLAFSPDGKLLVTATNKAPVAVWEVAPPRW